MDEARKSDKDNDVVADDALGWDARRERGLAVRHLGAVLPAARRANEGRLAGHERAVLQGDTATQERLLHDH